MRKFLCELEKNIGINAKHIAGWCKGIYFIHMITGEGGTLKHEYHKECKKCHRFIYHRFYRVSAITLCTIFFFFYCLISSTPQGAIRRRLFIRDGIDSAFTSKINKLNSNGMNEETYIVYTECGKEIWNVESLHFVCFAFPDD